MSAQSGFKKAKGCCTVAVDSEVMWECAVCGPGKYNRPNWCDLGCGSDYGAMNPVLVVRADLTDSRLKS